MDARSDQNVDIYKYPTEINEKYYLHLSLGDLHANAVNLIYALARENIITMSKETFAQIVEIYQKEIDALTSDDIKLYDQLIDTIKIKNNKFLTLIGDEIADRGMNDYFILRMIERLNKLNCPLEILFSNHGFGGLCIAFDELFSDTLHLPLKTEVLGTGEQASSYYGLSKILEICPEKLAHIREIYKKIYIPNLKLVSHSIDIYFENGSFSGHAPAAKDLNEFLIQLKSTADYLKVKHDISSTQAISETIDRINAEFRNNLSKYIEEMQTEITHYREEGIQAAKTQHPLLKWAWARAEQSPSDANQNNTLHDVNYNLIHGHDGNGISANPNFLVNKDNTLGKNDFFNFRSGKFEATPGVYSVERNDKLDLTHMRALQKLMQLRKALEALTQQIDHQSQNLPSGDGANEVTNKSIIKKLEMIKDEVKRMLENHFVLSNVGPQILTRDPNEVYKAYTKKANMLIDEFDTVKAFAQAYSKQVERLNNAIVCINRDDFQQATSALTATSSAGLFKSSSSSSSEVAKKEQVENSGGFFNKLFG